MTDARWFRIYEFVVLTYCVLLVIGIGSVVLVALIAMFWDLFTGGYLW